MMKKKLGPLPLWQWIVIGAVVGVGTVLYRRGHTSTAQAALTAVTPSDAAYNPIDPTTGLPISGGASTGAASTTGTTGTATTAAAPTLSDTLTAFGQLETLLTGLTEIQGPYVGPDSVGPAVQTDPAAVSQQVGTTKAPASKTFTKRSPSTGKMTIYRVGASGKPIPVGPAPAKKKTTKSAGAKNPGHATTSHGGGKKTATSSAPHNARQHHNVQSPSHQRHDPTHHPSAQHPAAKQSGAGHTPAAHPPAQREPAAHQSAEAAHPVVTHVAPPVVHHAAPPKPKPKPKPRRR